MCFLVLWFDGVAGSAEMVFDVGSVQSSSINTGCKEIGKPFWGGLTGRVGSSPAQLPAGISIRSDPLVKAHSWGHKKVNQVVTLENDFVS